MPYGQKTSILGIPVVDNGDRIDPSTEMQKYRIIENLLVAGLEGKSNCVFDDGEFSVSIDANGSCSVSVHPGGGCRFSIFGMVGGSYFQIPFGDSWTGLEKGKTHYLYVVGSSETFEFPEKVSLKSFLRPVAFSGQILIAVLDFTGELPVLDSNPPGKVYSEDILKHVIDSKSPHGYVLEQKTLNITEALVIKKGAKLLIEVDDGTLIPYRAPAASLNEFKQVDILSPGPSGVTVSFSDASKIFFAHASATHSQSSASLVVGDISFGYNGSDPSADSPDEIVVYNSGDAGVPNRVCAYCQANS